MTDAKNSQVNSGGSWSFLTVLLVIGVAVAILVTIRRREPAAGVPLPPMHVEGWLNTHGPLRDESLRGRLVLVDAWASWCGPCRANMPSLVAFHKRFGDEVAIVGLTPETGHELEQVRAYVESVPGLDWPIGYGATLPLDMLGVNAFPTLILFNKAGESIWAGHSLSGLESALAQALADET